MARKQRDIVGQKFGKLLVVKSCGKGKDNHYYSEVVCDCGAKYMVSDSELICGRRKSCKKCSSEMHGKTNTRLFHIWQSMKQRCNDKNHQHYDCYGGRGISICEEWESDFESFYNWSLEHGYMSNLSIDRIDNDGNYEPGNCRWVDQKTQANNKRNNKKYSYKGCEYSIAELSEMSGIKYTTLYNRLESGWELEKAMRLKPEIGRNQYETQKHNSN